VARIFKHTYTKQGRGGKRVTVKTKRWYIEFVGPDGLRHRHPGYHDKTATEQYAAELVRAAERGETDLIDRYKEHRKRPLSEHLDDFEQALLAKGATPKHAAQVTARARRLLNGCGFRHWPQISAEKVQSFLAEQRKATEDRKGWSAQTANFYLQAGKQFLRWLVRDGRAPDNRLAHLQRYNVKTDRRHDRRALSVDELQKLLEAAQNGPTLEDVTGPDRALAYRLCVETGLRVGELRSLTPASFDLDGDPPTLTVRAAYSKRRRDDLLPMRREMAERMAAFIAGRPVDTPLFVLPDKPVELLKADLAKAKIEYRDDAGKVVDWHALRHTFISNLAAGGAHPKVAQALARHSSIVLTMDTYTHSVLGDQASALAGLPDLSAKPEKQQERQKATGTDDQPVADGQTPADDEPESLVRPLVFSLGEQPARTTTSVARYPTEAAKTHSPAHAVSAVKKGASSTLDNAPATKKQLFPTPRRAGLEPATFGSVDRCSIQLS